MVASHLRRPSDEGMPPVMRRTQEIFGGPRSVSQVSSRRDGRSLTCGPLLILSPALKCWGPPQEGRGDVANLPTCGPLLILSPALKCWEPPQTAGVQKRGVRLPVGHSALKPFSCVLRRSSLTGVRSPPPPRQHHAKDGVGQDRLPIAVAEPKAPAHKKRWSA